MLFKDFNKNPSTGGKQPPTQLNLDALNAEWKGKYGVNEDGKILTKPDSPTGSESTEDQLSNQGLG